MAITTTPTTAMKQAIADEYTTQFIGQPLPLTGEEFAARFAEIIAVAIQQALIEVKVNAEVDGGDVI